MALEAEQPSTASLSSLQSRDPAGNQHSPSFTWLPLQTFKNVRWLTLSLPLDKSIDTKLLLAKCHCTSVASVAPVLLLSAPLITLALPSLIDVGFLTPNKKPVKQSVKSK